MATLLSHLRHFSPARKTALRHFGRRFGFDIRLDGINSRDDLRLVHFLKLHNISLVLDVGANLGQFGELLFEAGYQGNITSFEPLPDEHAKLAARAEAYGPRWIVAPCVALSDQKGTADFFVTEGSASSSLLEPLDTFVKATPQVKVRRRLSVRTERLDAYASRLRLQDQAAFLKLDVQGSESRVLAGATGVLSQIRGILVEMSLANLYAGQSSPLALHRQISEHGFEVWDIWHGYRNQQTQRLNQIDAVYFKPL